MNATDVQDLRTRSTQPPSDSSNRHRAPLPPPPPPSLPVIGRTAAVDFPAHRREVGRPLANGRVEDPAARSSVDRVFNAYGERIRADLRDMHGLCTQIVAQEKQEAAKWYALCAKVISERDHARRRLSSVLAQERNHPHHHRPGSSPGALGDSAGRLAMKRGLDTRSVENRQPMPLCLSPVHSPSASPSPTSPPSSSSRMTTTTPPRSSPPSASRSEFYTPFEQRPAKLRRSSCDMSAGSQQAYSCGPPSPSVKQQPRTPSPLSTLPTPADGGVACGFSHVDLMYVSAKGGFVCRACLLEKSKLPAFEPKAFALSASWDELRDHCVGMHPEACADVARLRPAEIFELRRRLSL